MLAEERADSDVFPCVLSNEKQLLHRQTASPQKASGAEGGKI